MKITAAVARGQAADFSIEEVELEEPRDDEVLVRMVAVGICHTDLVFRDQQTGLQLPAVLGHEGAGVVERVGSRVTSVASGDHVLLTYRSCRTCDRCADLQPAYCRDLPALNFTGHRIDGSKAILGWDGPISSHFFGQSSFASHALAFESNLVRVEKELPLALYAPLGCGVQTGAGAIMRSLACPSGSSLVVIGAGAVGLSAVMAAALVRCDPIIVIEPLPARRELAIELGAHVTVDPNVEDVVTTVLKEVPLGADFALDTSGSSIALHQSLHYLGSRGVLGLVGVPPKPEASLALPIAHAMTLGLGVRGIIEGDSVPEEFIPELIALHQTGQFPLEKITSWYPFAQINEAVAANADGDCVKAVLVFDAAT